MQISIVQKHDKLLLSAYYVSSTHICSRVNQNFYSRDVTMPSSSMERSPFILHIEYMGNIVMNYACIAGLLTMSPPCTSAPRLIKVCATLVRPFLAALSKGVQLSYTGTYSYIYICMYEIGRHNSLLSEH